ncbi:putative hemolysin [Roseovarius albus]|uniref:putative hemolysin n=1 Tax=Roseovarius albus TaxID=1247867 RepID=UPI00117AFE3C|nr:DUF333 domain-containing protein [Roseovarius albus]
MLTLSGCHGANEGAQLANPAAVYCVDQCGTLVRRETADGQTSDGQLPDGRTIDQREFYRAHIPT